MLRTKSKIYHKIPGLNTSLFPFCLSCSNALLFQLLFFIERSISRMHLKHGLNDANLCLKLVVLICEEID
ncbi:hypothetical protein HZS_3211 [Henneguya salminicola]|nr:hypothetical protein HZS_3211 [Henneguya salminicola]